MADFSGFSAEAKALLAEYESHGWTFRVSSKGHAIGKAPDGEETVSIGRQLSRANRSQQNAEAPLRRWLKAREQSERPVSLAVLAKPVLAMMEDTFHPSRTAVVAGAVALGWQPEQVVNGGVRLVRSGAKPIVVRKSDKPLSKQEYRTMNERVRAGGDPMRVRMAAGMTVEEWLAFAVNEMEAADITLKVSVAAPVADFTPENEVSVAAVVEEMFTPWFRPWKATSGNGKYDSKVVLERVVGDEDTGVVTGYVCAVCQDFESADDPISVARHAGAHRRGKGTQERNPVTEKNLDYHPTARLVNALAEWLTEHSWDNTDDLATLFLTWAATRPDLPPPSPREPLTDTQIVERIRTLVGGSSVSEDDYAQAVEQIEAQDAEIHRLTDLVERVTAERDRLQSDLDAWLALAPVHKEA
jgi:hypothetical protein